jgi:cystathionine beta-lyase
VFVQGLTSRNFLVGFGFNKLPTFEGNRLVGRSFKLSCSMDREMDVRTSALVGGVAECLNGMRGVVLMLQNMLFFWCYPNIWFSSYLRLFGFVGAELEVKEPSISTMLLNFENKSDPYEAMSTPLYQTATFKQVILKKFSQNFVSFSIQERRTWVLLIQEVKCSSGPWLCNLIFFIK